MVDWRTDWMLDEDDDRDELMRVNKEIVLPRKMPGNLQKYIDALFRAYEERNMGMYSEMEECIESEAKILKESGKISPEEMRLVFKMMRWA